MILSLSNSEFLMKPNKIPMLRNCEILFPLKIPSYKKFTKRLAMTSKFDFIRFYDVIIRNSVFQLDFLIREFQIPESICHHNHDFQTRGNTNLHKKVAV